METIFYDVYNSPIWEILLVWNNDGLQYLHIQKHEGNRSFQINPNWEHQKGFFTEAENQLREYFQGTRKTFDLKLNPQGTAYQKSVWKALSEIPSGEIKTYKDIAIAIWNPKASRAVGMANGKNPLPIIVPCHRVVWSNGKLTWFAYGLDIKQKLIDIEK